jgi:hypothetical protein
MTGDLGLRLIQRCTKIAHAQLSHLSEQQYDPRRVSSERFLKSCKDVSDIWPPVLLKLGYSHKDQNQHLHSKKHMCYLEGFFANDQ